MTSLPHPFRIKSCVGLFTLLALSLTMSKRSGSLAANVSKKRDVRKMYLPDSTYVASLNAALSGQPVVTRPPLPVVGPAAAVAFPARPESSAAASSDAAFVPGRPSAPVVVAPARASIDVALEAASSNASKQLALSEFELAKNANSVKRTRASHWRTYQRLHDAWYSNEVPVLPLTATKIGAVAAMFKSGRYSSYPNFIAVAKAMHLSSFDEHGIAWGTELSVAVRDATRSVSRGLGSTRQFTIGRTPRFRTAAWNGTGHRGWPDITSSICSAWDVLSYSRSGDYLRRLFSLALLH